MSTNAYSRRLQITPSADGATVALVGCTHLDEGITQEIREELLQLIEPVAVKNVVLSLVGVDYLTSTLLAVFMMVHKRLKDRGGKFVICDVAPDVYEIFEVTRLTLIMEVRKKPADPEAPD